MATRSIPLAVVALGLSLLVPASGASAAEPEVQPVHIVVLVDQSGSISPEDMAREKEAAGLIAQAEFSPRSTVAIIGFGSDSGGVPPVDVVCPPTTVAGGVERRQLTTCVEKLRIRERGKGDGTDHAEALGHALSTLPKDAGDQPKIVFLLTDGKLDVSDSERYGVGKSPDQRNAAARDVIAERLRAAQRDKVQVWPLGFGNVDAAQLEEFARSGYQGSCGTATPTPRATIVNGSADVDDAIFGSYSAARCAAGSKVEKHTLPANGTTEATVDIPAIATDGSIIVIKHDPRVGVEFVRPNDEVAPKEGSAGGSRYQGSGQDGAVESLRIVDPEPGRWKVRIRSADGVPEQSVSTAVTWQGAVQAFIEPDSSSLSAGQPVKVSVRMRTRRGPVVDAGLVQGLSFRAEVAGEGFQAEIPLTDDGTGSDPTAGDGTFTGSTTIPAGVTGSLRFTGHVTGIGISGDHPVANATVAVGPAPVRAAAVMPNIHDEVAPGGSVTRRVTVTNSTGAPKRVRVRLVQEDGHPITVAGAVHEAPAGNSGFDARLDFGGDVPEGVVVGTLVLVDDEQPSVEYERLPFVVTVDKPPPWLWIGLGTAALVLLAALGLWGLAWRRARDLHGLRIEAFYGSGNGFLPVITEHTRSVSFTVAVEKGVPVLRAAGPADPERCRLRRVGRGFRLDAPFGEVPPFGLGQPQDIGQGLAIRVTDEAEYAGHQQHVEESAPITSAPDPYL
ncbi:hypothetical protein FHS29_006199 [Saccharothrix tamanrassetensis]|uniref:VWFA domain-containing protein n=1 Tax=Saccharothrix tamanrassetensis TaxID=1051531 RepID=A0A841CTW5_9PSEU|nr:vWA domain-containing protein [Saccharothrix tamanrassetensis]MBB5959578.1 hypothetical protein [Saccharothrix tamanrassetensis]